jgi:hypothetical protein
MQSMKDQTQFAVASTFSTAKNNFNFAAPGSSFGSGGGGAYVNGGPIHIPQQ